jgi:hypothetical protein
MKKTFTILFLFSIILSTNGQISLTFDNQAIVVGDSHHFILADKTDEGSAGADQIWDFSGLKKQGDLTSYMLDASQTASGTSIPEATSVIKEWENYFYFRVSKNLMEEYGLASCNTVYKYDKPLIKIKFPFNYGNSCEGLFHGTDVSNQKNQLQGSYKIEADAYGKLLLPDNVVIDNVLRLKSVRNDISGTSSITTTTYRWYSSDVRYPLLTIIKTDNGGKTNTSITAYYADAKTSLKSATVADSNIENELVDNDNFTLSIYPNPYSEKLFINYRLYKQSDIKIEVVDNTGKSIYSIQHPNQSEGEYTESFTGKSYGLKQGVYFMKVLIGGKLITKKIVQVD